MNDIHYIFQTIKMLEISIQEEVELDYDDYQYFCLRILNCEKKMTFNDDLKDVVEIKTVQSLDELTGLFYEKMKQNIEEEDED